jgi:CDP-diacylglycerol--serine O-phosphatidyltransferase
VKHLPNAITLLNLLSGVLACALVMTPAAPVAPWLIMAGALFDLLDGLAARLLKASSPIGAQLDSLSDMVTFGVAPALLLIRMMEYGFALESKIMIYNSNSESIHDLPLHIVTFNNPIELVCLVFALAVALRLARFNTSKPRSSYFTGLASPAAGLFVSFTYLMAFETVDTFGPDFFEGITHPTAIGSLSIALSLLMISEIRMFSMKPEAADRKAVWIRNIYVLMAAGLTIAGLAVGYLFTALLGAVALYILLSVVHFLFFTKDEIQS